MGFRSLKIVKYVSISHHYQSEQTSINIENQYQHTSSNKTSNFYICPINITLNTSQHAFKTLFCLL